MARGKQDESIGRNFMQLGERTKDFWRARCQCGHLKYAKVNAAPTLEQRGDADERDRDHQYIQRHVDQFRRGLYNPAACVGKGGRTMGQTPTDPH